MEVATPVLIVLLSLSTFKCAAAEQANTGTHLAAAAAGAEMKVSSDVVKNISLSFEEIAQTYIQDSKIVGQGRLKIMFWNIYDAKLSAANGKWQEGAPSALSLTYLRDFDGEEIASRSVDEIRDIGYEDEALLTKWFEQMRAVFPNVKEGENITGVLDENKHTHFYHQGKLLGSIEDVSFGQPFFDIWLHEKTSEPKMRKQLLGIR
jgi:hypothetical protein